MHKHAALPLAGVVVGAHGNAHIAITAHQSVQVVGRVEQSAYAQLANAALGLHRVAGGEKGEFVGNATQVGIALRLDARGRIGAGKALRELAGVFQVRIQAVDDLVVGMCPGGCIQRRTGSQQPKAAASALGIEELIGRQFLAACQVA